MLTITTDVGDEAVLAAAGIWSRASARRDGCDGRDARDQSPGAETAEPGVRRRLALEGSRLVLARQDDVAVGFALFAPRARSLELFYLAVDPVAWGSGIGATLLAAVDDFAREAGTGVLELWVIDENVRAIAVYERAGYRTTDDVVTDPTSGRTERRLVRHLT